MGTTQMFVGNLPWSVRQKHLEEDFEEFGEVTDAFVAYKGRRSRGFGFVTMKNPKDAIKAQKAMDDKDVGEGDQKRQMRVIFAKERSAEDQAKADAAKEAASERREARKAEKESGEKPAKTASAPKAKQAKLPAEEWEAMSDEEKKAYLKARKAEKPKAEPKAKGGDKKDGGKGGNKKPPRKRPAKK